MVRIEQYVDNCLATDSDVPQETILGLIVFLIYINDITSTGRMNG